MHPAFSILFFTTLIGAGQGLVVLLALVTLTGQRTAPGFMPLALGVALVLLLAGLAASFLHLGRKLRAWRAVLMWRTSWMSREVIVLPAFIGLVALWALAARSGYQGSALPLAAIGLSLLLWWCTAMIYACLRFVQEWAHPLTVINFLLIGMASGLLLGCVLAALREQMALVQIAAPWALALTALAGAVRWISLRRNDRLQPRSSLQSATGIRSASLTQKSMGMTGGAFNTREFFHGAPAARLRHVRLGFLLLAFVLPVLLMAWALLSQTTLPILLALLVQAPGLLAERWYFFAQARHPQNLYYQVVS